VLPRKQRLQVYLQPEEYSQLKEWSEETGKSMSDLARDAILEYTDKDRYDRVEQQLATMQEQLDTIQGVVTDGDTHTRKDGIEVGTSETVKKTREVASRLNQNHNEVLMQSELDRAIKDIAGGDPRTVEKYRSELKERSLAFEHPNSDSETWFLSVDSYLSDLVGYAQQTQRPEAIIQRELSAHAIERKEVSDKIEAIA